MLDCNAFEAASCTSTKPTPVPPPWSEDQSFGFVWLKLGPKSNQATRKSDWRILNTRFENLDTQSENLKESIATRGSYCTYIVLSILTICSLIIPTRTSSPDLNITKDYPSIASWRPLSTSYAMPR